jgi:hypothetical protein
MADPLILISPGQQLPPEFFIHTAIPAERAPQRKGAKARSSHDAERPPARYERVLRACPGCDGSGAESVRMAGIWSGWFEKAQDQKPWFLAQLLVVLGISLAHRFC